MKDWQSLPVVTSTPTPAPTPTPTPEPLVLVSVEIRPFCTADRVKMAGLEVIVHGGLGGYSFFWEKQRVSATELSEPGHYRVFWPWESAPQVGVLTVESRDGQQAQQKDIYLFEPSCSP